MRNRLKDVTLKIGSGATPRGGASVYKQNGVPFVRSQNVLDLSISTEGIAFLDEEASSALQNVTVVSGDVLINITGDSVARVAIWEASEEARVSQHVAILRPDPSCTNSRYLQYWLVAEPQKSSLLTFASAGASRPALTKAMLERFPFGPHDPTEQKAIAEVLGALDDKIAANRRVQQKADELFHAVWLSTYDSIQTEAVALSSLVSTQYGLTASASKSEPGPKFLRVTDINKQNWIEWSAVPTVPEAELGGGKYSLEAGDLLVARMADPGKSAIYDDDTHEAVFASYLVRLKPKSFDQGLFLFGFLKSDTYARYAESAESGSVQRNMNAKVIVDVSLKVPSTTELAQFVETVRPLRSIINAAEQENRALAAARDELLPLLMSGKLSVKDAESRVEGEV